MKIHSRYEIMTSKRCRNMICAMLMQSGKSLFSEPKVSSYFELKRYLLNTREFSRRSTFNECDAHLNKANEKKNIIPMPGFNRLPRYLLLRWNRKPKMVQFRTPYHVHLSGKCKNYMCYVRCSTPLLHWELGVMSDISTRASEQMQWQLNQGKHPSDTQCILNPSNHHMIVVYWLLWFEHRISQRFILEKNRGTRKLNKFTNK